MAEQVMETEFNEIKKLARPVRRPKREDLSPLQYPESVMNRMIKSANALPAVIKYADHVTLMAWALAQGWEVKPGFVIKDEGSPYHGSFFPGHWTLKYYLSPTGRDIEAQIDWDGRGLPPMPDKVVRAVKKLRKALGH